MDTMVMRITNRGMCLYHRPDGSWYESDGNITFETEPAPQKTCEKQKEEDIKSIAKYM